MDYQRTSTIEREANGAEGRLSGILASDGEATDGHILSISGGTLPKRAPLLFGHDDGGSKNLGSWDKFEKITVGKGEGIRGHASIEMGGSGVQQEWRDDIKHMIDKKHINQFSIRWTETGDPIPRINLPSDHPAFVDAQKEKSSRKRWGLFFPKWRLLEGSVVTLGADPNALIGRMHESKGELARMWRETVNDAIQGRASAPGDLVAVALGDEQFCYVERVAFDAMLMLANERLAQALDIHDSVVAIRVENPTPEKVDDLEDDDLDDDGTTDDSSGADDDPETDEPAGTTRSPLAFDMADVELEGGVAELFTAFMQALDKSEERTRLGLRQVLDKRNGRVP